MLRNRKSTINGHILSGAERRGHTTSSRGDELRHSRAWNVLNSKLHSFYYQFIWGCISWLLLLSGINILSKLCNDKYFSSPVWTSELLTSWGRVALFLLFWAVSSFLLCPDVFSDYRRLCLDSLYVVTILGQTLDSELETELEPD